MKRKKQFILGGTALLGLSGCVSGREYRVPTHLGSILDIAVVSARATRRTGGVIVIGDARRPNGYAGPVPGHLHVTDKDRSGQVVATADARWGEFMSRRFRLAYFRAFLRTENPTTIASVSIEPVTKDGS